MAEEPTQAPAEEQQDTPATDEAAPAQETPATEEQPAESVDYQKRYDDLRPEYDRGQQELTQYRELIDAFNNNEPWALEQLGVSVQQPQGEEENFDLEEPVTRAEFQQWQEQQQSQSAEEEWMQADHEYMQDTITEVAKKDDLNLSEEEFALVYHAADADRDQTQGPNFRRPNVEGALEALKAIRDNAHTQYVNSKKAPKAPSGTAGDRKFDTSTEEGRREAMLAYMEEESPE